MGLVHRNPFGRIATFFSCTATCIGALQPESRAPQLAQGHRNLVLLTTTFFGALRPEPRAPQLALDNRSHLFVHSSLLWGTAA